MGFNWSGPESNLFITSGVEGDGEEEMEECFIALHGLRWLDWDL